MSTRPKSSGQVRTIFGEAKRRGIDIDALHELVAGVLVSTGSGSDRVAAPSIAKLTYSEAEKVIQRLKGQSFVPLRTLQYRRAKTNVQQICPQEQIDKIVLLAAQRRWSAATLANFCKRQCKRERPRTTADANKVIEALKAMNSREGLWAA